MTGVCARCAGRTWLSVRLCAGAVGEIQSVCRHHCLYPERLRTQERAPDVLGVQGGAERLSALLAEKVVAIVGTPAPSDYGERVTQALARDLAVSGVTVAGVEDGVSGGACARADQAGGDTFVVEAWEISASAGRCSSSWPANERALALLADLVIVVEAGEEDWDHASAVQAQSCGAQLAAVPGPIDSASSLGSNALIAEGAEVICGAQDALDALYGVGRRRVRKMRRRRPRERSAIAHETATIAAPPQADAAPAVETSSSAELPSALKPPADLDPRLALVLERVGGGEDTLAKLCVGMPTCDELTLALTELELIGLLRRGADGRYLAP